MMDFYQGSVLEVISRRPGIAKLMVETERGLEKAINYDLLTGTVNPGDKVVLNTTAVNLNLGTGGYHFVLSNLTNTRRDSMQPGHIMKLRYTPCQLKVLSVEEESSPYHGLMKSADSINGMPVVLGLLHSMLPYAAAGAKAVNPKLRIIYIMTDGGALPLSLSDLVPQLRDNGLLDGTITAGNSFGGDLEAVNIYTGLIAARLALGGDLAIVTIGPGVVGTGTRFGFSGLGQADIINAVNKLKGRPFVIPRVSFGDARRRHRGISHHTNTVLDLACTPATVVFPLLDKEDLMEELRREITQKISSQHTIREIPGAPAHELLKKKGIAVTSMGRGFEDDPAFFLAAGAAGMMAAKRVVKSLSRFGQAGI